MSCFSSFLRQGNHHLHLCVLFEYLMLAENGNVTNIKRRDGFGSHFINGAVLDLHLWSIIYIRHGRVGT